MSETRAAVIGALRALLIVTHWPFSGRPITPADRRRVLKILKHIESEVKS